MIRALAAVAFAALLVPAVAGAAVPPQGKAVDVALAYVRALEAGDYAKAYSMLARSAQRYFGSFENYASVWKADRFSGSHATALTVAAHGEAQFVTIRQEISYFNQGTQRQAHGRITTGYAVVDDAGSYRIDDGGHPYRSLVASAVEADRGGAKVILRELAFYPRRIEATVTFENDSPTFVTFLPYGRSVVRDGATTYHPLQTRDWLLTDRQLFLGLRLAPNARYTGQLNFLVPGRLDQRARRLTLDVGPALPQGADAPEHFTLPAIDVPSR